MKPGKMLAAYAVASVLVAGFARPGYDAFSGTVILLAGSTGSLKLAYDASYDIMQEDHGFSSEALTVCLFALVIWLLGALCLFMAARSKDKAWLVTAILIWLSGSGSNLIWFGIRSI